MLDTFSVYRNTILPYQGHPHKHLCLSAYAVQMTKDQLAAAIYQTSYITGEFLLRSGTIANEYFDKYLFESDPALLREIARAMQNLIPSDIDALAGLELGGIPLVTMLSQVTSLPAFFVRKKAKKYGTSKLAEGGEVKGKKLLIVEDVVTSGGQIVLSTQDLRDLGAVINKAVCVIDREAGGKAKLAEVGIELNPLFTMSQLKAASI